MSISKIIARDEAILIKIARVLGIITIITWITPKINKIIIQART